MPSKLLFLPGATGNTALWQPVSGLLTHPARKIHLGWPGFGPTPPDSAVRSFDDLVTRVVAQIDEPTALIAQSMGGVIALRTALEKPDLVTHLVLSVTSGGLDVNSLGAEDWRPSFLKNNPNLPRWFAEHHEDLSARLPDIRIPTLLLWGGADPISPVAVGQRLSALLPKAELHVFSGGDHDLANTFAADVAPLIDAHLRKTT
ncbi:alpha/beta fold hydrolase [Azohydromonas caseinilytica]|uniref:Alpha/beta hydrolase n=1 Tax=Azohydromonas caseinilytica TaxID=2728836 RepID=A0A848FCB5_9BURK|nr:alpha/beta fold hydrolase [Azohydromonas caseinilytica]NML15943.1 alpha/beta hydrolase [Azohydromonas caseinilytica]